MHLGIFQNKPQNTTEQNTKYIIKSGYFYTGKLHAQNSLSNSSMFLPNSLRLNVESLLERVFFFTVHRFSITVYITMPSTIYFQVIIATSTTLVI